MKSLETMARYKKELTECARNLKLPFLAEHLDEILHEAQEKQQTYSEFLSTCLMRELRDKERRSYLTRLKFAGWLDMAGDEVCAAALLDILLYCCEIIRLSGKSYRMENRKTIFSNQQIGTAPQKGLMKVKKRTKESGYC